MATTDTTLHHHSHQAYQLLHVAFIIAPIIAGLDKFFYLLTDWTQYLAPIVPQMLGIKATTFMLAVGVIEIVAGLVVWFRPRFGGYLVMAWLWAIIINLLLIPGYFDIVLRDFGLSLGALALARLSEAEVPVHAAGRMHEAHV
ncbi:MAG TPA: hypothetical protein VGX68_00840 [Thermoanaerobaculia bacterium]|jgi:hypothetical protein|nr:hypothetical protein [Thermoanaerobaculia bacterium]